MASDKELNIGIKVTSDTAGAKQATAGGGSAQERGRIRLAGRHGSSR